MFESTRHLVYMREAENARFTALNHSKIRPSKMHDYQTESSMILVWFSELIQPRNRELKASLRWSEIIQDIVGGDNLVFVTILKLSARYGEPERTSHMDHYWIYKYVLVDTFGMQKPEACYFIFDKKGELIGWHQETHDNRINIHGLIINLPMPQ